MEHQVKTYTRRTRSGKNVTVRAHTRKGKDGAPKSKGKGGYYRKYQKDIDEIMEQTGVSLKDAIRAHSDYMRNDYDPENEGPKRRSKRWEASVRHEWNKRKQKNASEGASAIRRGGRRRGCSS